MQRILNFSNMKKVILIVLMGLLLCPMEMDAKQYKTRRLNEVEDFTKSPTSSYVSVNLNETTGILTLYCVGNVSTLQVTISQNGVDIEDDYMAVSNGQSVIYDLSSYSTGIYIMTIELGDGTINQYIISVVDD